MKSLLALMVAACLVACEKRHMCECHKLRPGNQRGQATLEGTYFLEGSRPSAESSCVALETKGSDSEGEFVLDCEISD
jgi:hypothetical protein